MQSSTARYSFMFVNSEKKVELMQVRRPDVNLEEARKAQYYTLKTAQQQHNADHGFCLGRPPMRS